MKLNDLFDRMKRRHQTGYEAILDSLSRNNISTMEAAHQITKDTRRYTHLRE